MSFKVLIQFLLIFIFVAFGILYYFQSFSGTHLKEESLVAQLSNSVTTPLDQIISQRIYIEYAFLALAGLTIFMLIYHFISYMQNKRKILRHQEKLDQLHTLIAKSSHLFKDIHEARHVYEKACKEIVEVAGFSLVWIGKYSSNTRSIESLASFGNTSHLDEISYTTVPQHMSSFDKAYLQNKTVVNNDLSNEDNNNNTIAFNSGLKSNASLLIKMGTDVEAVLTVYSESLNCFDHHIIILLQKICDDISHALELIKAETLEEKHLDELRIAAAAFDTQEAMIITDTEHKIVKVNKAYSTLTGYSEDELLGENPRIVKSGEHDKAFYEKLWESLEEEGSWKGELINKRKNGELFTVLTSISNIKDFDGEITHYIEQSLDISEQKKAQEQIIKQAFHDTLTGLANRTLLLDRLTYSLSLKKRSGVLGSLFFIDMDNFKNINDSYGHDIGDLLLIEVAQRLLKSVRKEDTICRIGGDEFVVLIEDLGTNRDEAAKKAKIVAQNILLNLGMTYRCKSIELFSSPSIGITLFPDLSNDPEEILKQADISMYVAKKGGKNSLYFYNEELDQKLKKQKEIERNLREALLYNEFELFFQPKISIENENITGIVSLIYWRHPTKGLLDPSDFLEIAISNNFIIPLEEWALRSTCQQIKDFEHMIKRGQSIAINISSVHFKQKTFIQNLKKIIEEIGIRPSNLEIELSESIMFQNTQEIIVKINELKELGIKLSLNSFGTGSSSLYHLKELPIKEFKIDKSFIEVIEKDESSYAVVETIIRLAHVLDLKVIADGVKNVEQLGLLEDLHCDIYQGNVYAEPINAKEFTHIYNKPV